MSKTTVVLSVVITCHAESILTHRTLKSVRRALENIQPLREYEIILHADNPTPETLEYISTQEELALKDVRIFQNSFGDLGESRNFAVKMAQGKYIATIDADDLMSRNWLSGALSILEEQTVPTVVHSEVTVEFEGSNSLIIKEGGINFETDALLSVFANRWNSVIVTRRSLLLDNPYTPNSPGYGYEDWNLNCRLIYQKVQHLLVPETAIFVRRKKNNSEWARQIRSMAVLRANPLLAFDTVRSLTDPFKKAPNISTSTAQQRILERAKHAIKKNSHTHKIARYVKRSLKRQNIAPKIHGSLVAPWLQTEWQHLHTIDRQIFPSEHLMSSIEVYSTITEDHKLAGSLYKGLVDQLRFNKYDYVIFAPWLTKGGADKYTIEYANTIAAQVNSKVLVVTTLPSSSPWANRLSDAVDHLDFGNMVISASEEIRQRLMEHIIENANARVLHVINSEFGYDFIQLHEKYIKASKKKVVITSFSQSFDQKSERTFGYSHTHVPFVHDIADLITSDNQAVLDMWINDYGFNPNKLIVHRQPVDPSNITNIKTEFSTPKIPRILWTARIAPEKLPELTAAIGKKLEGIATIDMFGSKDDEFNSLIKNLPDNVSYRGSYDGFDTLDVRRYDMLLYTSLFDGMPNTLLEAASAQLPIVTSGVGGIPEFVESGKNGLVVMDIHNADEYVKAILHLFENNLGKIYALNGRQKIEHSYSREQYNIAVQDMLERLKTTD